MNSTDELIIVTIVCSWAGLFTALISYPLAKGMVERNRYYGFRTKKTLSDEKIWLLANTICARKFIVAGFSIFFLTPVLFFVGREYFNETVTRIAVMSTTPIFITYALISSWWAIKKL